MTENKPKEGVSIKEIEEFTKRHRFEVVLCLGFILACIFSFAMWGTGWAIIATALGALVGTLLPGKVEFFAKKTFEFIFKHDQTVQLILGIVFLILSVFLPPLCFLAVGLHGGKSIHHLALEMYNRKSQP